MTSANFKRDRASTAFGIIASKKDKVVSS